MSTLERAGPVTANPTTGGGGLAGLYRESFGRMGSSAALRRSFALWAGSGFVFTAGLAGMVALLHQSSVRSGSWAVLGATVWWALVTAVVFGGAALLRSPDDDAPVERYGLPNGLTALRTYASFPLFLMASLSLPGRTGLALWCSIGFSTGMLDAVDGFIARRSGPLTRLGRALDPASDAVFFATAAVGNVLLGILPLGVAVLTLVRYLGPFLLTPVVFLLHRRPELVHTTWGRRNTILTGIVMFICMWVRIFDGPVGLVASVLAVPLVLTTLLHFWSLAQRAYYAPVVRRRLSRGAGPVA